MFRYKKTSSFSLTGTDLRKSQLGDPDSYKSKVESALRLLPYAFTSLIARSSRFANMDKEKAFISEILVKPVENG